MADDVVATLERAAAAGVERVIHVGCSRDRMDPAVELAQQHEFVFAVVGVHPHEADTVDPATLEHIATLSRHPKVVAIGETGLDYHYDRSPRARQLAGLAEHADLARDLGLPLVLHIRDAHQDALDLLRARVLPDPPGMVHCFTGGPDEARAWLDLGFCLSFSGIATFPSAGAIRDAARLCPSDRLLLETDAPYLTPVPLRGRPNEPANVAFTCANIAKLREVAPPSLASTSSAALCRLLAVPPCQATPGA